MNMQVLGESLRLFLFISMELTLLFVGISFLVGLLQEYIPPEKIQAVLGGHRSPLVNNTLGACFGALTPFCSCSTIPITLGLLNGGAPFSAAMSFLIASPLINPVIIGLLLTLMGLEITIIYVLITFPAAVLIGYLWDRMGFASQVKDVYIQQDCCDVEAGSNNLNTNTSKITNAVKDAWQLFTQMLPWLLVGAGIGAFIYGFVPESLIVHLAGPDNPLAIPVAALIGIPMYIRAETMLPISQVLLSKGMGIGAVMALIIGGAGASIPEVSLLAAIFKRRLVIAFIVTILLLAVVAGLLFSILV